TNGIEGKCQLGFGQYHMGVLGKECEVMVISVSLYSSEESVGTPARRVILFNTILNTIPDTTPTISPPTTHTDTTVTPTKIPTVLPTVLPTVPPSPDHTPASPDYSPASPDYTPASDTESDPSEDPSSDHIPPLPAISPFLSSTDDTTNSDTPDTPPSPTHDTHFTEITASTQRSPIIPRRRVMILAPRQPIPYRRPYRYHLNRPLYMLTARKRVGPLPTHRLVVRHSIDHSLLDYFSPEDSAQDSSSDLSSEASSDFHLDASSDSSSRHSLPDHSSPNLPSTFTGPSRKDSSYLADVEVDSREGSEPFRPRGTDVGVNDDVKMVDESYSEHKIDLVQTTIEACFYFADIIRSRGINVRVVAETVARDRVRTDTRDIVEGGDDRVTRLVVSEDVQEAAHKERAAEGTYETLGNLVQRFHDHTMAILVHRVQVIKGIQRENGHRIVVVELAVTALTKRIVKLERDNRRLRGTVRVKGLRVDRLQRDMSLISRHLKISPSVTLLCRRNMPNTRSGASMTHEEVKELVFRRVAKEMEACEAVINLEPLNESGDEQEVARECTFQDFLKCKPHNFSGTEGVVGLTCWFEKIEVVFNISNCPSKYQVKYATCTLQDNALTWWNFHKRTIGVDAAYAMKWVGLMKLMTEVYCPRNEIQKMETELWNPTVKGND
nr:hypothetical protein [Tanacetum cinerariifolium]